MAICLINDKLNDTFSKEDALNTNCAQAYPIVSRYTKCTQKQRGVKSQEQQCILIKSELSIIPKKQVSSEHLILIHFSKILSEFYLGKWRLQSTCALSAKLGKIYRSHGSQYKG